MPAWPLPHGRVVRAAGIPPGDRAQRSSARARGRAARHAVSASGGRRRLFCKVRNLPGIKIGLEDLDETQFRFQDLTQGGGKGGGVMQVLRPRRAAPRVRGAELLRARAVVHQEWEAPSEAAWGRRPGRSPRRPPHAQPPRAGRRAPVAAGADTFVQSRPLTEQGGRPR